MIEKVEICNAVQSPQEAGVGAGLNGLRAKTRWHEDNLPVCWHVPMLDDETLMQAVWSAQRIIWGGILIPSPVCRQHDLIWTSESKISRNLQQVEPIFSSVFLFPSYFEFDLWITPVGSLVSAKLPKLTLFLMRKLRPQNAENLPIKGYLKRFLHIVLISSPIVHRASKLVQ